MAQQVTQQPLQNVNGFGKKLNVGKRLHMTCTWHLPTWTTVNHVGIGQFQQCTTTKRHKMADKSTEIEKLTKDCEHLARIVASMYNWKNKSVEDIIAAFPKETNE
jgi:hypothetical protein